LQVAKQFDVVALEDFVPGTRLRFEREVIGETGTSAALHTDAQTGGLDTLLLHHASNFVDRFVCNFNRHYLPLPSCFFFQSVIAALIASSARTEQWIFTGGRLNSLTISVFLIASASASVLPFTHSVARLELAMALPQPKVLNFASSMTPLSSLTLICNFITSPHSGAPTRPVPTLGSSLESAPTFRGLL